MREFREYHFYFKLRSPLNLNKESLNHKSLQGVKTRWAMAEPNLTHLPMLGDHALEPYREYDKILESDLVLNPCSATRILTLN